MRGFEAQESGDALTADLVAQHGIEVLQRCYFHSVDTKDWSSFRALLTDDVTFDFRQTVDPDLPPIQGRDAVVDFVARMMEPYTSIHRGFLRKLDFSNKGSGRAVWSMEDIILVGDPGALAKVMHGYGHYQISYRKEAGTWLIESWLLTRTLVEHF